MRNHWKIPVWIVADNILAFLLVIFSDLIIHESSEPFKAFSTLNGSFFSGLVRQPPGNVVNLRNKNALYGAVTEENSNIAENSKRASSTASGPCRQSRLP